MCTYLTLCVHDGSADSDGKPGRARDTYLTCSYLPSKNHMIIAYPLNKQYVIQLRKHAPNQ